MYSDVEENKCCVPQWRYDFYAIILIAADYRQHVHAFSLAYAMLAKRDKACTLFQTAKVIIVIAKPCHFVLQLC